jgi:hypothetical protein
MADDQVSQDNNIDLRERTELRENDNLDKDSDLGNTLSEHLIPDEVSERRTSLDGYLGEVEDSLGLEEDQISAEDGVLPSWKLVEEPDLSPEVFETLWRKLPET